MGGGGGAVGGVGMEERTGLTRCKYWEREGRRGQAYLAAGIGDEKGEGGHLMTCTVPHVWG